MPAHRRPAVPALLQIGKLRLNRKALTAGVVATTAAGFLVVASSAAAASTWFVSPSGTTVASCGTTAAAPCNSVATVQAKAAYTTGDTINLAAGTYTPQVATKGGNIVGATTATTIIDGSASSYAFGVASGATGTVSLSNVTLTKGAGASGLGGGIYLLTGTMTTSNVAVTQNTGIDGAGVFVNSGTSLSMTGGSITSNVATASSTALTGQGGGVYVVGRVGTTTAAGLLALNGVTVSNNSAVGTATAASGNGGGIFNAGTTTITNSTFTGNTVTASTNTSNPRRGQGGAIFNGANDADDLPSLTITSSAINGGLAAGAYNASSGGGIANAESFGGLAGANLVATNVTMSQNSALLGGALYNGGTISWTGGGIMNSSAFTGAGLYQTLLVIPSATRPSSTFDGAIFTNNVANGSSVANFGNGGAIFNQATLTVKNATLTGNQAVASTASSTISGWGGAIYNGPFAANDVPTLNISSTTINGGSASSNATIGGAIANVGNIIGYAGATNGAMTATNVTFEKNSAAIAGAVYTGGATSITGSTFDQNSATNASVGAGGGIYASKLPTTGASPVVTIDSTAFTKNTATVLGGAVALTNGASVTLQNGSSLTGNSAVEGGGVYNSGALTVTGSSVSTNTSSFQGGGIYNGSTTATDTPSLVLSGSTVDGNTAANVGGGIETLPGATLTATGGEVSNNSALGGGGLYVGDAAPASFSGTNFDGNTATASFGGAVLNSGALSIDHATLDSNIATHTSGSNGIGAAIYSGSSDANIATSLKISSSTISNNQAYGGAALVTYSPASGDTNNTSIDDSTITGNTNSSAIGSIEQFHPLTLTNSTITNNTSASGASAGLYMVVPSTVSVAGDLFSNNSGGSCSSKPVDGGYNLSDATDTSCGFTAANHDVLAAPQLGALANNGGKTLTELPGPASPALDKIPAGTSTTLTNVVTSNAVTLCAAGSLDQRDIARPQGAKCDIGSVEVVQVVPTVSGPSSADYSVGNMGTAITFTTVGTPQASLSESGALPAGVTFVDNGDGTGTLSGTPGAGTGGSYPITVKGTNEAGTGTLAFTLTVHQAPVLGGPSSATFTVGQAGVPQIFSMKSGYPNATLSTSSTLPSGVTFVDNGDGTGTLSGTPAVGTGGVYAIVIKGTNGTPPDSSLTFTLTVDEGPTIDAQATATFTVGTAGTPIPITTTGTPTPSLSVTGLPAGLTLHDNGDGTGSISGTPAAGTGGMYVATVTAANGVGTNATTTIQITVEQAPALTGPSAARVVAGTAATIGFSSTGYPQATVSESGALPSGMTFTAHSDGTGTISGTPASNTVGTYPVTITASNGIDPNATISLVITVAPPVSITTTSLPAAQVGTAYGAQIMATGGQPAYAFSVTGGALPAGLTLNSNGTVSGTPTGPTGNYSVTVKVVDSAMPAQTDSKTISITVGKGVSTLVVQPVLLAITFNILNISYQIGTSTATLTGGTANAPIVGQTVTFTAAGTTLCSGVTNSNGVATCTMTLTGTLLAILTGSVQATYSGSALWQGSTGTAGLLGS